MPIYEFYCEDCNTIFNFFSRAVNTTKQPVCPRCKQKKLKRQMSTFVRLTGAKEESDTDDLPIDEASMEKAMNLLAREADSLNEDDPRQSANLMRKFSDITGLNLGPSMEEAMKRMEAGEDPEQVEAEMGDLIEDEEPFILGEKKASGVKRSRPHRDKKLYEL